MESDLWHKQETSSIFIWTFFQWDINYTLATSGCFLKGFIGTGTWFIYFTAFSWRWNNYRVEFILLHFFPPYTVMGLLPLWKHSWFSTGLSLSTLSVDQGCPAGGPRATMGLTLPHCSNSNLPLPPPYFAFSPMTT